MAVKRIHSIEKYIGESTSIKPITALIGSEFYEYDTKLTWICYDKVAGVAQWGLKGN